MRYGQAIPGEGTDRNRYYRCRNCGFIVDSRKVKVGPGTGAEAVMNAVSVGDTFNANIHIEQLHDPTVVTQTQYGGTNETYRYQTAVNIVAGCPLCGSKNYR
jgi:hypothetical protein